MFYDTDLFYQFKIRTLKTHKYLTFWGKEFEFK